MVVPEQYVNRMTVNLFVTCVLALSLPISGLSHYQHDHLPQLGPQFYTALAFKQPPVEESEALLRELSDPDSPKFGQYLSSTQLDSLYAPSNESLNRVIKWLNLAGVPSRSIKLFKAKAEVRFLATSTQLQGLFETASVDFDSLTDDLKVGTTVIDHAIPPHLDQDLELATSFQISGSKRSNHMRTPMRKHHRHSIPRVRSECGTNWTPTCIRELYKITRHHHAAPNNSLGIYGSGDAYNQANLDNFFSKFAPYIPNGTHPDVDIINGAPPAPGEEIDGEQLLDLQVAYPIAYPQKLHIFQTPAAYYGGGFGDDFLDAVDSSFCKYDGGDDPNLDPQYPQFEGFQGPAMCGSYSVTNVLSISFATDEYSLGSHYGQRQCHEWMKLALQGVTVIVAAGDRGVQGNLGCLASKLPGGAFNPLFPGSCPYVTTVGATQVNFTGSTIAEEVAVYDPKHAFYSGGGFSNFNARPSYQEQAVNNYFSNRDPGYPLDTFNRSGRAYPDVALLGANITISDNLEITVSGGTSAAAPLFAAMINRINDERLLIGKKPIGFLNHILYKHPEVFTDITKGNNPGCDTQGFEAAKGWDPVSGLGSPVFPRLRHLLVSLP